MHTLAKKYRRLVESYIGVETELVSHRTYFGADNEDKACHSGRLPHTFSYTFNYPNLWIIFLIIRSTNKFVGQRRSTNNYPFLKQITTQICHKLPSQLVTKSYHESKTL